MILINYSRSAAAASGVTATALATMSTTASGGGGTGYTYAQDVSTVPSGARCLLCTWASDSTNAARTVTALTASAGATPVELVQTTANNGTVGAVVSIWSWTRGAEASPVTFTVNHNDNMINGGFQLIRLTGAHASTTTNTQTGTATAATSVSLTSGALTTPANGIAVFAANGVANTVANPATWSTGTEHADDAVENFLRLHSMSIATTTGTVSPTLTRDSGSNDVWVLAGVSIPPV